MLKELQILHWSMGAETGQPIVSKIPTSWKEYIEMSTGFVYVVSPEGFIGPEGSWQKKRQNAVHPLEILQVNIKDLSGLPGNIVWVN